MPSKHRITVNPTPEFMQAIQDHKEEHRFESLAAALLDLAAKGLGTGIQPRGKWGKDTTKTK